MANSLIVPNPIGTTLSRIRGQASEVESAVSIAISGVAVLGCLEVTELDAAGTQINARGNVSLSGELEADTLNVSGPLVVQGDDVKSEDLQTLPEGMAATDLVIDPLTGRLYRQS